MGKRVEMNDAALDMVTGGAFNFYSRDGQSLCYVDGVGTFNCDSNATSWIVSKMTAPGADPSAIAQEAIAQGMLWS